MSKIKFYTVEFTIKNSQMLKEIVFLPIEHRANGNISVYDLLKQTGYFETHDEVNEKDLIQALSLFPQTVQAWFQFSEDKRSAEGWYFLKNNAGSYTVAYYKNGENFDKNEFIDVKEACAHFIKMEIEEIRNIQP